jgi:hypothetical protein
VHNWFVVKLWLCIAGFVVKLWFCIAGLLLCCGCVWLVCCYAVLCIAGLLLCCGFV